MGRFVNPDNSAFQVALNSKIYVDKTGLIAYANSVLDTSDAYICSRPPAAFWKILCREYALCVLQPGSQFRGNVRWIGDQ